MLPSNTHAAIYRQRDIYESTTTGEDQSLYDDENYICSLIDAAWFTVVILMGVKSPAIHAIFHIGHGYEVHTFFIDSLRHVRAYDIIDNGQYIYMPPNY